MSPELTDPGKFGLKTSHRTEHSDCYALGMVVYEVLSGQKPFFRHRDYAIVLKTLEGEHPNRPQGAEGKWFTDDIWAITECCWKPDPGDRPSIDRVLQYLDEASRFWTPPSPLTLEGLRVTGSPALTLSDLSTEESVDGEVICSNCNSI